MPDSTHFEFYRPNAEPMTPAEYDYAILAFQCPACNLGLQRPVAKLSNPFEQIIYQCETCEAGGTRKDIDNGVYFAKTIRARDCVICDGKIFPAADRMSGKWWTERQSRNMIWRCDKCGFVGDFVDFALEANRRSAGNEDADNAADMRHPVW